MQASPGLKAGRGLKLGDPSCDVWGSHASPGLKAGRGLKLVACNACTAACSGIARPQGRARIETGHAASERDVALCIARPQGRARIETNLLPSRLRHATAHRPASRPGAD